MTIKKGVNWGELVAAREDGLVARGDLARELGFVDGVTIESKQWLRLPLDLIDVVAVDEWGRRHERTFATWLEAGGLLRGEYCIVSSTSFVRRRRIFSRAHPNDGRLDWLVIEPSMSMRQRWGFRRRTRSETHLPHPLVDIGTGPTMSCKFSHPVTVRFESSVPIKAVVELTAIIRPDATVTHIPAP